MWRYPICVNCICHSCGHQWKSDTWIGRCPMCGSDNISQKSAIDGSKLVLVVEK